MVSIYTDFRQGDVIEIPRTRLIFEVTHLQGYGDFVLSFADGSRNRTLLKESTGIINDYLTIINSGNRGYGRRAHVAIHLPSGYDFRWRARKRNNKTQR